MEKLPPEKRSAEDKRRLELQRRYLKEWNAEMGRIVGERIAAGDYTFFHELAAVIEALEGKNQQPQSISRSLALKYKWLCDELGWPFTLKGLRDFYAQRKHENSHCDILNDDAFDRRKGFNLPALKTRDCLLSP